MEIPKRKERKIKKEYKEKQKQMNGRDKKEEKSIYKGGGCKLLFPTNICISPMLKVELTLSFGTKFMRVATYTEKGL